MSSCVFLYLFVIPRLTFDIIYLTTCIQNLTTADTGALEMFAALKSFSRSRIIETQKINVM